MGKIHEIWWFPVDFPVDQCIEILMVIKMVIDPGAK